MIYTLTLNPSLDYVIHVDNLETGKIHKTNQYSIFPGGKGINVSQVLNEFGVNNIAWGYVAGHTGVCLEQMLEELGIATQFIHLDNGITRINTKIRSSQNGGQLYETDINGAGPIINEDEKQKLADKINNLNAGDVLVISGSVPPSISVKDFEDMLNVANSKGVKLVVDASGVYLAKAIECRPWLIKPNVDEAQEYLGTTIANITEATKAARSMADSGAQNVILSMGKYGAVLVLQNGDNYHISPPEVEVVNTVGAGDSLLAGFIASYAKGGDMCEALNCGVCVGSATAASEGLAKYEDIKGLLEGDR